MSGLQTGPESQERASSIISNDDEKTVSDYSDPEENKMSLKRILINDLGDSHGDDIYHFYDHVEMESEKKRRLDTKIEHKSAQTSLLEAVDLMPTLDIRPSIESEYSSLASQLNVSAQNQRQLVDTTMDIYTRLCEKRMLRGAATQPLSIAAFFVSCRKLLIPCSFFELSKLTGVSKKDIGRYSKLIQTELQEAIEPVSFESYVERFAKILEMSQEEKFIVQRAVSKAMEHSGGRCHLSIIAGCILASASVSHSMSRYTKKDISEALGVAEATVASSFRALVPYMTDMFPSYVPPVHNVPSSPGATERHGLPS